MQIDISVSKLLKHAVELTYFCHYNTNISIIQNSYMNMCVCHPLLFKYLYTNL
jgi:hypothetical protein